MRSVPSVLRPLAAALAATTICAVSAEPIIWPLICVQCDCDKEHPYAPHSHGFADMFQRVSITNNGTTRPFVTITGTGENEHVNQSFPNNSCENIDAKVSRTIQKEHTLEVNGSTSISETLAAEIEAAGSVLVAEVKAAARVSGTVTHTLGGAWTTRHTESVTIETGTVVLPCDLKRFRAYSHYYAATGTISRASTIVICAPVDPNSLAGWTECAQNAITLASGDGKGHDLGTMNEWTYLGRLSGCPCGGGTGNQ